MSSATISTEEFYDRLSRILYEDCQSRPGFIVRFILDNALEEISEELNNQIIREWEESADVQSADDEEGE